MYAMVWQPLARAVARPRLVALVVLLAGLCVPMVASAHEHREVGAYEFVVGFQDEPSYVNQPNGIWLSVREATPDGEEEGKPVEGLERTLRAEVTQGSRTMSVPLRPAFGEAGVYLGDFIPTKEGDYLFHFTGSVGGQAVDETFESGPEAENRFSGVRGLTELQFPEKQPDVAALQASVEDARDEASQARAFGYAGIGLGALGLIAALTALATRRARTGAAAATRSAGS